MGILWGLWEYFFDHESLAWAVMGGAWMGTVFTWGMPLFEKWGGRLFGRLKTRLGI